MSGMGKPGMDTCFCYGSKSQEEELPVELQEQANYIGKYGWDAFSRKQEREQRYDMMGLGGK